MNSPFETNHQGNGRDNRRDPPAPSDPEREPFEELAEEFAERLRSGHSVRIEGYTARYPEFADEIRELFPTIAEMERLNRRRQLESRRWPADEPCPLKQIGDFRVIGEIGRGGMGIVYEAEQVTLGRRVAVKVLPKQALRSERDIQRFQREARTAAQLHHSNIVPVFGVGAQDGIHYIVMQFIQGVGLDEILEELKRIAGLPGTPGKDSHDDSDRSKYIQRNAVALLTEELRRDSKSSFEIHLEGSLARTSRKSNGSGSDREKTTAVQVPPPPSGASAPAVPAAGEKPAPRTPSPLPACMGTEYWRNVTRIGMQAASALHYAHSHGTLHRDVKPANLLLDSEGGIWIADFGLAKAAEQDDVTWTGDVVGTLAYLAPERFDAEADARSDLYSLGLTLYELVTLRRAFGSRDRAALVHQISHYEVTPPRKLNPLIPRDLETIILKAIARDPADRYQSAGAFAADLQNFLEDRPILARRMSPPERLARWCRRNRAVAGLTAAVAVLLVLVTTVATIGYARESFERMRAEAQQGFAEVQQQRAEVTSALALQALDRIYSQFAASPTLLTSEPVLEEGGDAAELVEVQSPLPLSDELAGLLENLLEFYGQLSEHAADNQDVLTRFVMANRRVGDIHYRLGDLDRSREAYERAIERQEAMAHTADADQTQMRLELARIYNGLGTVLREQHKHKRRAARAAHQRALELLTSVSPAGEVEYERARSYYLLHQAERSRWGRRRDDGGDSSAESGDHLEAAIHILDGLVEKSPAVPDYRFLLAQCYLDLNRCPSRDDGLSERVCQETAVGILEQLIEEHPEVPDYRYVLGNALWEHESSRWWKDRGRHHGPHRGSRHGSREAADETDLQASETRLLKALEVTENLDLDHPNIPQYLMLKTRLHAMLAHLYEEMDRLPDAIRQMRSALRKQDQLVRRADESHIHKFWLIRWQEELAELLIRDGQLTAARDVLRSRLRNLTSLQPPPDEPEKRRGFEEQLARAERELASIEQRLEEAPHEDQPSSG